LNLIDFSETLGNFIEESLPLIYELHVLV
jgi:hypothetical protein